MKKNFDLLAAAFAIFAMFFGAGNIVFPLVIGTQSLNQTPFALLGFILTAVVMPFIGFLTLFFYQGRVDLFFGRIGKIPGLAVALFTISLLGPFGSAPRCLSLAYSTLTLSFPSLSLSLFAGLCSFVIFLFTVRPTRLLSLIGYVLSPIKITLLLGIIIQGCIAAKTPSATVDTSWMESAFTGLKEGYNTMDLLAAFFFAPIILLSLKPKSASFNTRSFFLKASCLGAILLSLVYIGFAQLAYFYADKLHGISSDRLLGAIAIEVLGSSGGVFAGFTVAVACLTTAIALVASFTHFVHQEILQEKIHHTVVLASALCVTFLMTTLEFQGIAQFLGPILEIGYPFFIALTLYNLLKEKPFPFPNNL